MIRTALWVDGSGTAEGPIGWAFILQAIDTQTGELLKEIRAKGSFPEGTSNRAELMAVLEGLKALTKPARGTVYSDSEYVVNAISQGWVKRWQGNGWWAGNRKAPAEPPEAMCPVCASGGIRYSQCVRHDPPALRTLDFEVRAIRSRDLWEQIAHLLGGHAFVFQHVAGHTGIELNEQCDRMAGVERQALKDRLAA